MNYILYRLFIIVMTKVIFHLSDIVTSNWEFVRVIGLPFSE